MSISNTNINGKTNIYIQESVINNLNNSTPNNHISDLYYLNVNQKQPVTNWKSDKIQSFLK